MDNSFHIWFCEKLGIPASSIIYPTENLTGDRPDFIIRDNDVIIGYIEVELGDENTSQLSSYKYKYESDSIKIISITGKSSRTSNLSLEEIRNYLSDNTASLSNQQKKISFLYLIKLIDTYTNNNISYTRNPVSAEVLKRPFVNKLLSALENFKPDPNQKRAEPGKYYIDTTSEKGFSFRVYSIESTLQTKTISLLSITKGRDYITFLSAEKYRKYLNHKNKPDVENWINFIQGKLQLPIDKISIAGRSESSISTVEKYFSELIKVIVPLL